MHLKKGEKKWAIEVDKVVKEEDKDENKGDLIWCVDRSVDGMRRAEEG